MRCRAAVAVAVAGVLGVVAPRMAAAQAGWDSPVEWLSIPQATGGAIYAPKVDVDGLGNAVALWTEPGPTLLGTGPTVRTARYEVATRRWGSPQTLSSGTRSASAIDIAVDAAGNALAIFRSNPISVSVYLVAARYDAASGTWSSVDLTTDAFVRDAVVAMNGTGDAIVCWADGDTGLGCRRYSATTATWAPIDRFGEAGSSLDVALDAAGRAHLVWSSSSAVRSARFDAGTGSWSAAVDLATSLPTTGLPAPHVAANEAGDAVATWTIDGAVYAARFTDGGGWRPVELLHPGTGEGARAVVDSTGRITVAWIHTYGVRTTISRVVVVARFDAGAWSNETIQGQGTFAYSTPGMAVDDDGNVFIAWGSSRPGPGLPLGVARRHVSTGAWSLPSIVSETGQSAFLADVAVAGNGDAVVVWFQTAGGISTTQARHWRATPASPTVSGVTPSAGALDLVFGVAPSADPVLEPTNVEYSLDDGNTWTTRSPASLTGPLTVSGLVDGQTYLLRLRLVNTAGTGTVSPPTAVRSGIGNTPTDFRVAARSGHTLTFTWVAPPAGFVPAGYLLEGGFAGTSTLLAAIPTGGPATEFTITLPAGAFFTRVVAIAGLVLRSPPSNEAAIAVGLPAAPAGPTHLLGSAHGSTVALSWTNQFASAMPTSLLLNVTGAITTSLALPVSESFTFTGVPPGTYTFALRAMHGVQAGPGGNAVTLTFPGSCTATPNPPTAFSASSQGGRIFLDWLPPAGGEAVTHYVVSATGAFTGSFPSAARSFSAPVPPGSYTIRVAATGPCGTSAATPAQTVVVP